MLRKVTWAGLGMTGAAGVGALTLGLLANGQQRLFKEDSCYQFDDGSCPPDFVIGNPDFHARAYQRYAQSAYILTGVSVGLAVTTLAIGLVSRRYARQSRRAGGRARVRVTPGLGGLTLHF
ncbi:hypothetical protein ENSA5_14480 [Enhygromyxa salina]|uniref:Transmembrane protein n=1 Tax=Enhygromyxa salina TaxID=215803 RepID=A0A2S9YEM0_9BACT|nr:hypothetical protein [Enhygromyxa salina]PRQ03574.1 hypothetical protein ENSA5_14480 [Enhygromyxa salina]